MATNQRMALRLAVLALVAALIVIALLFAGKGFNLIDFLKKLHGASL